MKKFFLSIIFALCAVASNAQQATMPCIIVFPSNKWMLAHGFADNVDADGEKKCLPHYSEALNTPGSNIGTVLTAIQQVFADRGFNHKDLQGIQNKIDQKRATDLAYKAKGQSREFSPVDEIMQQAQPDIRMDVEYEIRPAGRFKNIKFELKALDAYTAAQVGSIQGTIEMTADPVDLALRKFIAANCDQLCGQLTDYFTDLCTNGRKINVEVQTAEGCGIDMLNDEVNGEPYVDFISNWITDHAVNKAADEGTQTETTVTMENVRIPMFEPTGRPTKARTWAKKLVDEFKAQTGMKMKNKVGGKSLGDVTLILGAE